MKLSQYWKVPGRQVYCERLIDCIFQTFRCHIWLRVFPPAFLALTIIGCAQLGLNADTFNKRIAAGYVTVQTVAETAAFAYDQKKITDADKTNVVATGRAAVQGLDLAQSIYAASCPKTAPQPCVAPAADAKLQATLAVLTALQAYLATKGAK